MASEIAKIPESKKSEFKKHLNNSIKLYPGNAKAAIKTINNWRTEISALFGFIEYNNDLCRPSRNTNLLNDTGNLITFFRKFLAYFQYPGGHLKPEETYILIKKGIKFKPVQYIIDTVFASQEIRSDERVFGLTKAEVTHCIFNDIRVTTGKRTPKETAQLIIYNRDHKVSYDNTSDVVRYAGDILDYMVLANLADLKLNNRYYIKIAECIKLMPILKSTGYFCDYSDFYNKRNLNLFEIKNSQQNWFSYINTELDESLLETDIVSIIEEAGNNSESKEKSEMLSDMITKIRLLKSNNERFVNKDIGNAGEALALQHEYKRLENHIPKRLLKLIKKIPDNLGIGYDIKSYEDKTLLRFIEVKTSVSRSKLEYRSFKMSENEWNVAGNLNNQYYVYRFMISSDDISLFIIKDPVKKYKTDLLKVTFNSGAEINYNDNSGTYSPILA
jgi:hypothetical protein